MIMKTWLIRFLAFLILIGFTALTWRLFNGSELLLHMGKLALHPGWLLVMFGLYLLSFVLKAEAWRMYANSKEPRSIFLNGLFYSLLVNHLSFIKAGDLVRTGIFMKAAGRPWDEALHTVAVMRMLDMLVLAGFAGIGTLWLGIHASWLWMIAFIIGLVLLLIAYKLRAFRRVAFLQKHLTYFHSVMLSAKGWVILLLITASWILEAGVIFGIAQIMGVQLGAADAVWANSVTIAGQIFHITPGGIGTYESTLSGTLAIVGVGWKEAYAAAVLSHGFKFVFSYGMGLYACIRMPVRLSDIRIWASRKKESSR